MALVHETDVRCRGCNAGVSVWEEGLCAFCRMEERGDDQLLSHDSRGYLDHDGVSRVPCGCGCNGPVIVPEKPSDPVLGQIRDLIDQHVEIRLPYEPMPWRREWIESLGGAIVIDPEAPMPLAMQNDRKDGPTMNGFDGREALDAMDRGERQQPPERGEAMGQCKIPGCEQTAIATRGRFAYLCADHKAERLAEARREGSLGGKNWHARPEPKSEPAPLPAVPTPPPTASGDPERVDAFELFDKLATEERIAYYERAAEAAQLKAEALREIRAAVEKVRELEPA